MAWILQKRLHNCLILRLNEEYEERRIYFNIILGKKIMRFQTARNNTFSGRR